jgi:alkylhydroperoxidase family enzyme
MSPSQVEPRIPPVAPDEQDDQVRAVLDDAGPDFAYTNIFATLLRHPTLTLDYRRFGDTLRKGVLPARDREILVLRTAWRCRAAYEWGQHVSMAQSIGMSNDEIALVARFPQDDRWSPFERALLRAADDLHDQATISDDVWATLAERYDDRGMVEVSMLVGNYHMLAFLMNSARVQPEPGVAPLPAG